MFLQLIKDLTSFPKWGSGIGSVWGRNFLYFKYTFLITVFWVIIEPSLYLFAIGKGIGVFVGDIDGRSYLEFFFPALLCTTGMLVAFFESTYASFTRMHHQKTFDTILLTPITADEIGLAEILWATSKGFLGILGVLLISSFLGLVNSVWILPCLLILFLNCWIFASLGILVTATVKHWDTFIYVQSGFVIPMSLFSGTYFPLYTLPDWIQSFAYLLPLTHSVMAVRSILDNEFTPLLVLNIGALLFLAIILSNLAIARLRRRIVV